MNDENQPDTRCPDAAVLKSWLLGNLQPEQYEPVAAHVDECPRCQSSLTDLDVDSDDFVESLRRPTPGEAFEGDKECASAISQAEALTDAFSSAKVSGDETTEPLDIKQLGPYLILEKLGAGGMGSVYKALHTRLDRIVAVKVLGAGRLEDPEAVARFDREMKAVGRLEHPHIVRATDADQDEGRHYLVMEFVDGIDLSRISRRLGPLSVAEACELIRQAAVGLQHVHEHGLVHRDIKPSNLMLARVQSPESRVQSREEQAPKSPSTLDSRSSTLLVKILDLGLALLDSESGRGELTSTGQVMGTVDYMPPEQLENTRGVDIRADIYSLGATLYRLLTGQVLFPNEEYGSTLQKIAALARDDVPSVSTHRDDLPSELVAIVDRMVSRDPADRYQTPEEVADALASFSQGADLVGLLERAESAEELAPNDRQTMPFSQTDVPSGSPRRTKAVVGWAASLLVIGVFAIWAVNHFLRRHTLDVSTATGPQPAPARTQAPIRPTFQRTEQPFCSGRTVGVAFADLDDDGDQDVVVASYGNVPDQVWLNEGHGQFAPGMNLGDGRSTNLALADLNGDRKLDAFFTSRHVANSVWFGDGTGQFTRSDQILGKEICRSVALNDLDGDGDIDAVIAEGGAGVSGSNTVLFNDGSGVLEESNQRLGSRASWSVAAGDLDGDGDPDVVFGNGDYKSKSTGWQPNSVWLNDGRGQFEKLPQRFPESHCFKVLLGDLDGDGDLDAAFTGFEDQCSVWFNDGSGRFIDSGERTPIGEWSSGGIEDLDQDRDLDIVFAAKDGAIQILLNDGSGRFPERIDLQSEPGIETALALADVDGDGDVDLFVGNNDKEDSIWLNQLVPTRVSASPDLESDTGPERQMVTLPNGWQVGEPVNLGPPVNSQWNDADPAVTPGGLTLLFTSSRSESDGLWISTRASTVESWGEPVRIELNFDEKVSRYGADISADGLVLLFASERPGGIGGQDLWQATRTDTNAPWGEPVNLGPVVNSNVMDVSPSVSEDGLVLLFASSRPTVNESSIWMSTRPSIDDPWREPVKLPPAINSSMTEGGADLSSDGLALVFESRREGSVGVGDLWMCTRSSVDEPWNEPVNLGPQVNTTTWDAAPAFTQNDTALYFSSRRPKGNGNDDGDINIWMVPVKRPEARGKTSPKAEHRNPPGPAVAPFGEQQAAALQKAWADHLGQPVEYENSIGMKLRLIPPGEYTMGSPDHELGHQDNEPQRRVTLTRPFYLGATEVTKAQFDQFVRDADYETTAEQDGFSYRWDETAGGHVEAPGISWRNPKVKQVKNEYDRPVVDVTWLDAVAFCEWLSRKEGRTYRLPTEAEWEYACRAGTTTAYWFGDDCGQISRFAWHKDDNLVAAAAVAQKPANPWGLYDMHGNASEWPLDVLGDDMSASAIDPVGDVSPDIRIVRSGNFHHTGAMFRSANRLSTGSMRRPRNETIGFRVALELSPTGPPEAVGAPSGELEAKALQKTRADWSGLPTKRKKPSGGQPDHLDPAEFGLTVHEEGWALTQILRPPDRIRAAGFHPVTGQLYFGNQKDQERWFHCVDPNGSTRVVYKTAGTSFAFSPDGRQLLVTNGVENNLIAQIDAATGEVVRQMDPKPNQDDDPAGIAFAPSGWTGSVVNQEQALGIDMGYAGPRGLWRISLDGSAPEQIAKNPDDLSSPIDLTITRSEVYVINRVSRDGRVEPIRAGDYNERIYRFEDGTFLPIRTDRPIADASGIAFDPIISDLLVLCGQTLKDPTGKRVLRLHRPAQGDLYRVTDVFSGLTEPGECGIDISPDGRRTAITDCGAGAIYVFSRAPASERRTADTNM